MTHKYFSNPQEKIVFSADGPQPQSLFAEGQVKVIVAGLNAGQKNSRSPRRAFGIPIYRRHWHDDRGW